MQHCVRCIMGSTSRNPEQLAKERLTLKKQLQFLRLFVAPRPQLPTHVSPLLLLLNCELLKAGEWRPPICRFPWPVYTDFGRRYKGQFRNDSSSRKGDKGRKREYCDPRFQITGSSRSSTLIWRQPARYRRSGRRAGYIDKNVRRKPDYEMRILSYAFDHFYFPFSSSQANATV